MKLDVKLYGKGLLWKKNDSWFYRQKIQEILATQKKRISFENQISFEEETLSAGSESGILEEHSLTVPKEDKLNEFEAELKVYNLLAL